MFLPFNLNPKFTLHISAQNRCRLMSSMVFEKDRRSHLLCLATLEMLENASRLVLGG